MQQHGSMIIQEGLGTELLNMLGGDRDFTYPEFGKKKKNTWLLSQFTSIFTVLNAIIQLCNQANLSHTRPKSSPHPHSEAAECRQPSAPQTITR